MLIQVESCKGGVKKIQLQKRKREKKSIRIKGKEGNRDGSAGTGNCCQARHAESSPRSHMVEGTDLHMCIVHMCVHTQNNVKKIEKGRNQLYIHANKAGTFPYQEDWHVTRCTLCSHPSYALAGSTRLWFYSFPSLLCGIC